MKIIFVGDINIGEYYLTFGHGPKTKIRNFDIFESVESILCKADIVAGNLEAPLCSSSEKRSLPERQVLRGDPQKAAYLASKGFNVLQVSNNHIVQHGKAAFNETISSLEFAGIVPVGVAGESLKTISIDGKSIGFMAASDVPDNTDKNQNEYNRLTDDFLNNVKNNIKKVDHLFVMLHWGLEKYTAPMEYQTSLMNKLSKLGVRGIIGSHPHLFYPVIKKENCICAPSLGNFVFDLCWDSRLLKSGILELDVDEYGVEAVLWPVELTDDGAVPLIVGNPVKVVDRTELWNLGSSMRFQQIKKVIYFFKNIRKGDTSLKIKFIINKFRKISRVF
jgi:capsule synthesis protein PGA_cap